MLCNNNRWHIILWNKTYSTVKCHDHYINIINIWEDLTKCYCITVIFVSEGSHTYWLSDLNPSSLPVRFMGTFSGSLWSSVYIICVWSMEARKCHNNLRALKQMKENVWNVPTIWYTCWSMNTTELIYSSCLNEPDLNSNLCIFI